MNFYDDQQHDHQLVQRTLAGDSASFNTLIEKYHAAAWAQAYQWVQNPTDTQDILQAAFLKSYQSLNQLTDPRKFPSWLREIIVNVCKMHIRGKKSLIDIGSQNETQLGITVHNQAQTTIEAQENHNQLNKVLDTLPSEQAFLVRLFYFNGYTYRQIARFLDLPITTIESRLHKARQKLRQPQVKKILKNLLNVPNHVLEKERYKMPKVEIKFGTDLIEIFRNEDRKNLIFSQISTLRKKLAQEKHIQLPPVRLMDDITLSQRAFQIHIEGDIVYKCELENIDNPEIFSLQLEESVQEHADQF